MCFYFGCLFSLLLLLLLLLLLKMLTELCSLVSSSIASGEFKHSYVSLIISKAHYQSYVEQSRRILSFSLSSIGQLDIKQAPHLRSFCTILRLLLTLTNYDEWRCFQVANGNSKACSSLD